MIVITGLDGSGKSTFHNELESTFNSQMAILRLPTMDSEKFKTDPILFKCCQMINELGERGDKETQPGMKIIAMFSVWSSWHRTSWEHASSTLFLLIRSQAMVLSGRQHTTRWNL